MTTKDIPGWEGLYQATTDGDIISCRTGKKMSPGTHPRGYRFVKLSRDGKVTQRYVHRLVLLTFVGPPPDDKPYVLHGPGGPGDNRLTNVRYGTQSQNNLEGRSTRRSVWRNDGKVYRTLLEAANDSGGPDLTACIGLCCKGKRKTAGGFTWKYA